MTEENSQADLSLADNLLKQADPGTVAIMYVIYSLHAFCVVMGLLTPVTIVSAFLTGWPSILALLLSYLKQEDGRGTYLESHFSWVIRTFWFAILWVVIAYICIISIVLFPVGVVLFLVIGAWVLYRILRGAFLLLSEKPAPTKK